jgi:serine/threonine protein kinase
MIMYRILYTFLTDLLHVLNSGYMSPEYAMGGAFSMKSDTYDYGVLILEIVSGMKISSPQLRTNFSSLITYVIIMEYVKLSLRS